MEKEPRSAEKLNAALTPEERLRFLYIEVDGEIVPNNVIPFPVREEPPEIAA